MQIFGLNITRQKSLQPVDTAQGIWRTIFEPFAGAWQQNKSESQATLVSYPTLYACLNRIAGDIGKLPFVIRKRAGSTWNDIESPAFSPVLRKPNNYQTAQQFRESWALAKLLTGNVYVLKQRDNRGIVTQLYVLDSTRVLPLVSDDGAVFYQVDYGYGNNLLPASYPAERLVIPAREIIHDRMNCFNHQLIGVPPLCAAYWPTVKNSKILTSASKFFANNAQPGGLLTAPAGMSKADADAVKSYWDANFSGDNAGKVGVIGADMKFTSFAMKGADAQLVEQMQYSDQQICQPFGVPPFKVGIGSIPAGLGVGAINLLYFDDALSAHIEAIENLLDEGLAIPSDMGIWMDTEPLLRMDVAAQADVEVKLVGGKIKTPDEGRARFNLAPTGGGSTLWGQHQDYPLGILAERNDLNPAPVAQPVEEQPDEEEDENDLGRGFLATVERIVGAIAV